MISVAYCYHNSSPLFFVVVIVDRGKLLNVEGGGRENEKGQAAEQLQLKLQHDVVAVTILHWQHCCTAALLQYCIVFINPTDTIQCIDHEMAGVVQSWYDTEQSSSLFLAQWLGAGKVNNCRKYYSADRIAST